jgi:hypothetical protein
VGNKGSESARRALDRLAYISLFLDICIAIITSLGLIGVNVGQQVLVPVNYLLTVVVALSILMFIVLLLLKSKERQLSKQSA